MFNFTTHILGAEGGGGRMDEAQGEVVRADLFSRLGADFYAHKSTKIYEGSEFKQAYFKYVAQKKYNKLKTKTHMKSRTSP